MELLNEWSASVTEQVLAIQIAETWMTRIIKFLKGDGLQDSLLEVQKVRARPTHYLIEGDLLYKRGYGRALL